VRDERKAGYAYVVLDGTLIPVDSVVADRPFRSDKHNRTGMNLQVTVSPRGDIRWVGLRALPGSVRYKKAERIWGRLWTSSSRPGWSRWLTRGLPGRRVREDPVPRQGRARIAEKVNRAHAKLRVPWERAAQHLADTPQASLLHLASRAVR
jgi:hypothetical protein